MNDLETRTQRNKRKQEEKDAKTKRVLNYLDMTSKLLSSIVQTLTILKLLGLI